MRKFALSIKAQSNGGCVNMTNYILHKEKKDRRSVLLPTLIRVHQ